MDKLKPGQLYKHYKGDTYKIIILAKHSETGEWMVVYERMTSIVHTGYKIHARPLEMFLETVEIEGKRMPRFELLK